MSKLHVSCKSTNVVVGLPDLSPPNGKITRTTWSNAILANRRSDAVEVAFRDSRSSWESRNL